MKMASNKYYIDETVDIFRDYKSQEVVVVQQGKEIFRRPATQQNISIAHSIYMGVKYKELKQKIAETVK